MSVIKQFEQMLPPHKGELSIEHNQHKGSYESAASWLKTHVDELDAYDIPNTEARSLMEVTNEIWTLTWYPYTPVGRYSIAAPNLESLMAFAKEYI